MRICILVWRSDRTGREHLGRLGTCWSYLTGERRGGGGEVSRVAQPLRGHRKRRCSEEHRDWERAQRRLELEEAPDRLADAASQLAPAFTIPRPETRQGRLCRIQDCSGCKL